MVLFEIDGVVKIVPVAIELPPVNAVNQLTVPSEAVASKDKVPAPHLLEGVVAVIVGIVLTVANTAVLSSEAHPLLVAST